jgi:DnaK suppressor protein
MVLRRVRGDNHVNPKALNKKELKKFQELLEEKRAAVLDRARKTLTEDMTLDTNDLADEMDLASSEYIQSFEFRLRGREKTHLAKIDLALKKITDGTFGVCDSCGEPIGKKRLEARPETTLCIRCKEDQERDERTFG